LVSAIIGLKKPTFLPSISKCLPIPAQIAVLPAALSEEITYNATKLHLRLHFGEAKHASYYNPLPVIGKDNILAGIPNPEQGINNKLRLSLDFLQCMLDAISTIE
jgi:hypothetical protein